MDEIIALIRGETGGRAERFELIRAKQGVHVYRCLYDGQRAVAKYFENKGDRREIHNYRLLQKINAPSMKTLLLGESCFVMEDINASETWRLGEERDMEDSDVLRGLARWYFALHEGGEGYERLEDMYSENDELRYDAIEVIRKNLPGAAELCDYVEAHMAELRSMLRERENTVVYNDFYYTNLLVRKDKSAAMMFDYNYMGRGYRYADFRNVQASVSKEAFAVFMEEYAALHSAKYGKEYVIDGMERRLDEFISPFLGLVSAFQREQFPAWAEQMKEDALGGALLLKGKEMFGDAQG